MKKFNLRDIVFYIIVIVVLLGTIYVLYDSSLPEEPKYSEIVRYFEDEQVVSFAIDGDALTLNLVDGKQYKFTISHMTWFYNDIKDIIAEQREKGILQEYDLRKGFETPWWMMLVPYAVLAVVFILLWYFMMGRAGGGGENRAMKFGKARTRLGTDEKKKITFNDVAGAEEEKEELSEIVDFLKNPARFVEVGARIPKGVLLVGPPGTGKTYLAKAVAGEAHVPFYSLSGSEFVEMFVGVGAKRVRDLFEQAKKAAPSIIFIDEIDAVGRQRGAGMGGGHDEREQTLNQLLVEMDGFGNNEGVIIMAATNRQDILDPALLRPGRFDRQVYVGLPDIKAREAVLKIHARGKPLDADVDLGTVAKTTGGFSPADLENLLNEAALLTVRRGRRAVQMTDIEEAMIKVIAGPAKKSKVVSDKERKLTAFHEGGHAIVMRCLEHHDPVHQISIIPRGMAGGMTISLPNEDKSFMAKSEMFERIVSLLGGRVAEHLTLDDISTGASNDISRATDIARKMVTRYGMSDAIGPIAFGSDHDEVFLGRDLATARNYSEEVAANIDKEIKRIIDEAYRRCEQILRDNIEKLRGVAAYLLAYETMDSETFEKYMDHGTFPEGADVPGYTEPKLEAAETAAPAISEAGNDDSESGGKNE
ncbi:ATP-dependent zinc metalloprotease FtsH [Oscillospiraceae bacterium OttesenSCG-928-F05]|nr:ATP-dependent zinc metalloprotease FtsH [Oscillospiraceae bacterium OttesenSCG-928-F05]